MISMSRTSAWREETLAAVEGGRGVAATIILAEDSEEGASYRVVWGGEVVNFTPSKAMVSQGLKKLAGPSVASDAQAVLVGQVLLSFANANGVGLTDSVIVNAVWKARGGNGAVPSSLREQVGGVRDTLALAGKLQWDSAKGGWVLAEQANSE